MAALPPAPVVAVTAPKRTVGGGGSVKKLGGVKLVGGGGGGLKSGLSSIKNTSYRNNGIKKGGTKGGFKPVRSTVPAATAAAAIATAAAAAPHVSTSAVLPSNRNAAAGTATKKTATRRVVYDGPLGGVKIRGGGINGMRRVGLSKKTKFKSLHSPKPPS
jgi:hypothetical protein